MIDDISVEHLSQQLKEDRRTRKRKSRKGWWKRHGRKQRYGITQEQWDAMFESQGRCCKICKGTEHCGMGWNTDHDHKTGEIRGILCRPCNAMLGYARDNVTVLAEAIKYLTTPKGIPCN